MLGSPPASSSSKSGGFILLVVLSILAVSGVFYRKEEDIHVNVDKCISLPLLFYSSMFHLNFKNSFLLCMVNACPLFSLLQLIPDLSIFMFTFL